MVEKYLVIYPSGKLAWAKLERKPRYDGVYNGEAALNMDDIRKIIGCEWLEHVQTIHRGIAMLIDETGKIQQTPKPHNERASLLYGGWNPLRLDDIVGTAVIFGLQPVDPYGEQEYFPLTRFQRFLVSRTLGIDIETITEEVSLND